MSLSPHTRGIARRILYIRLQGRPGNADGPTADRRCSNRSRPATGREVLFGLLIYEVATACEIPNSAMGQTTWKRREVSRGLEADQCYHFDPKKIALVNAARRRRSLEIADYPNPDLAVEIDISAPLVDREAIYQSRKVGEIWSFDGDRVKVSQFAEDGTYAAATTSRFLPIKDVEIQRWIVEEDWGDQPDWCRRLRAWLRRVVSRRKPPGSSNRRGGRPD